ncbi:TetR/AcrR family transcriptional regulator [Pseudoalteromonas xiamenensis]
MNEQQTKNLSNEEQDSPREKLLRAAKRLFIKKGYGRVTTRAIAEEANVNMALIKYYFVDKAGLFETVFRDVAAPLLELIHLAQQKKPNHDVSPYILTQFIERYYKVMSQHPTLPKIIFMALHDTSSKEHAIVKKIFFDHLEVGVSTLNAAFSKLTPEEPIRTEWLLVTCIGMSVFPFVMPPVLRELLGVGNSQTDLEALGKHQQAIFNTFLMRLTHQEAQ